jgi:GT2 family glycosyltransferase
MTKSSPRIAIIILNWRTCERTVACLRSLESQDYADTAIIVVDNGSHDGSVECIHRIFPAIELIANEHNLGFAAGVNRGIRRAVELAAEYILLLNSDTTLPGGALEQMVARRTRNRPSASRPPRSCIPGRLIPCGASAA